MHPARLFILLFCGLVVLRAEDKSDLQRVDPVPASQAIPVQDFFRPALLSNPKVNSAGTYFAASVDVGDRGALFVCNLTDMKADVLYGSASKDLYAFEWLDKTHLITSWATEKIYADGMSVTNAANLKDNYAVELNSATELIGVPRRTPMEPLVWIMKNAYNEGRDAGVVRLDARKNLGRNRDAGVGHPLARADDDAEALYGMKASILGSYSMPGGLTIDYLADKDGQLAFAVTADAGVFTLLRLEHNKWIKCPVDLDQVELVEAGDTPSELIVVGPRQEGKPRALQRLDAATGALGQVLLQDTSYDAIDCRLYRNPVNGTVLGVRFPRNRPVTAWFDESYRQVQAMLEARFPAQIVQIVGSDEAENRFFVRAYSDRQPVAYYSLDLHAHAVGLIKRATPWLDPARMAPMAIMKFKTRDGLHLEAFLTLPPGASKEHPVPLVVLPHGGPWARDSWGFDPEAQFLASRGYAVLQPNYRGSTGYNWMYPASDQWEFRKMHEDVTDAVKTLVGTGLVDPSRLAIMGSSFGGYLAVCGAVYEPGLYRCAITIAGVFDWEQVMRESRDDQYTTARFGILRRNLGDPAKRAAFFDSISPLRHIDQIKIPIFVAHGKEDNVADVAESRSLVSQLEKFHVAHESLIVGGEGHGMYFLKNQVDLYSRIEVFLSKNLSPAVPADAKP